MSKQTPLRALALLLSLALFAPAVACAEEEVPASPSEQPPQPQPQIYESGLVITHIQEGAGAHPLPSDRVVVHYTGRFANDEVFDSSVARGEPARFPLAGVIACWTEGVQLMRVGGKARLLCPPRIAYGLRGAPPVIPPNATLYFDVELLGIEGTR